MAESTCALQMGGAGLLMTRHSSHMIRLLWKATGCQCNRRRQMVLLVQQEQPLVLPVRPQVRLRALAQVLGLPWQEALALRRATLPWDPWAAQSLPGQTTELLQGNLPTMQELTRGC